ncbi:PREDICTED: C-type lectin domain family 10 member A-like isoform X2 [Poecilia mexicana]|uniref:C-type lectin domain family 10 member A-like isoform X2 n=1 Tax=Poecilia mexicana TaxID=48701 RepID=UPI00072EE441|nr:PREDICTED: C-type lectin domain family 10 member A-like isoform X2 [Poecilia mexicana]
MAEEEVSYASVAIKSKKQPQSEGKNENETVYDEVKVNKETKALDDAEVEKQNESVQQTADTNGLLPDKAAERCRRYQQLCFCFGTLCLILVLSVIGVCVYFRESTASELNQLKSNQKDFLEKIHNLTNLNNKLSSDNDNLTSVSMALKNNITMLTAENHNLTSLNEKLMEDRKNLTEIIETWNELNVSRAQWSIDQYCPTSNDGRRCTPCQSGWNFHMFRCYLHNNANPSDQKTWEEAQEYCKTKNSNLTVVSNQAEKKFVDDNSWAENEINGYWIGLRAVKGKWKWINGSDLTDLNWIHHQNAVEGHCVTSRAGRDWNTMNCNDKNAWICEKKALSV